MTNTLHRYGLIAGVERLPRDGVKDDYVVFMMPTRGVNEEGCVEKLQAFLQMAIKYNPVNLGDARKGGIYRPSKSLNPLVHWRRKEEKHISQVIEGIDGCTTVSAVFDNPKAVVEFLKEVKEADLGISVNISAPEGEGRLCCQRAGITRHSVEFSLGFQGQVESLPDRYVLEIALMCGHGMVLVKEGRRKPEEAALYMAKFCTCGVFNPTRAMRLLEEARLSNP